MEDREFNELDLRRMLQHARAYRPNIVEGRWVIEARRQGQPWEIIVEPDEREQLLGRHHRLSLGKVNAMREPYLEVTFRHGRPLAAYLYLPRSPSDRSRRTVKTDGGLIIDYTESGKPIGIEITAPAAVTIGDLNAALKSLNVATLTEEDLVPLRAA